jgi:diketogulonate reductase-like aldo/keto reductase
VYKTDPELGTAIKESGVPREKLFVTAKVDKPNMHNISGALKTSLEKLQLEYVDLYDAFVRIEPSMLRLTQTGI